MAPQLMLATAVHQGMSPTLLQHHLPFQQVITLAALAFLGTLAASRLCLQLRLPAVFGVLVLGLLLPGPDILSPYQVENLDTIGLAMLLFYAGLRAELTQLRGLMRYGPLLALAGLMLSSLLLGALIWATYAGLAALIPGGGGFEPLPASLALMAGACLSSTDSGPALQLLKRARLGLPPRVAQALVIESSLNAPLSMLVLLLVASLATAGGQSHAAGPESFWVLDALQTFLKSIGSGVMVGLIMTYIAQFILRRLISDPNQILLLGIALALSSYGLAELLHGSGYIAAYVTGMFLTNDIFANKSITPERLENSLEPFNTLMEFSVVLLFGNLIRPTSVVQALLPGLVIALGLMLIARPLSVLAMQRFSPFSVRNSALLAWCGLRGAVPLALTYKVIHTIPLLPGIHGLRSAALAHQMEGLVAVVVLGVLVVQGLSLPAVVRRLNPSLAA